MNASLCMDPKVADKRSEEIGGLETLFNSVDVNGITLQLDNVTVLRLSSRLYVENGEGYFVAQNVAESSADPQKVYMLKIQSPPCPWEFYVARKIQERTFGDAKLVSLAIFISVWISVLTNPNLVAIIVCSIPLGIRL